LPFENLRRERAVLLEDGCPLRTACGKVTPFLFLIGDFMKTTILGFFGTSLVALVLTDTCSAQAVTQKKLIGWSSEPNTQFMREHIAEMETTPFDGCVFRFDVNDPQGTIQFAWNMWGRRAFTEAEAQPSIHDLKATPFKRFTHNFLRVGVTPADLDWFDDFSSVLNNARLAAKVAREGKAAGIMFDVEQYDGNHFLFAYEKQRDAKTKSLDQYAAQARLRGRELMQAFQEGYPDVQIMLTYAYGLSLVQERYHRKHPGTPQYALLAPMLDGMIDAATGSSKIIDGYEHAYGYKTSAEFDNARKEMHGADLLSVAKADPAKLKKHLALGYGLWLDFGWRDKGWDPVDAEKNYFTPQSLEQSVRLALESSDEYVWLYHENPQWWSPTGKRNALPPAYDQALRRAMGREETAVSAGK
jgi:hypothetical protein